MTKTLDEEIRHRFTTLGHSDSVIARALGKTKGQIVGRRHRLGIMRDGPGRAKIARAKRLPAFGDTPDQVARAIDERDLDILSALEAGEKPHTLAARFSVGRDYIERLQEESKAA